MFQIHYMYIVFALFLFLTCFLKNTKAKAALTVISFVLIFVCSEIGADYGGYKYIYENCSDPNVHGETLYLLICKMFLSLHCSYELFRVIFLTSFLILFVIGVYGLSDDFSMSFLFCFLTYLIYLISAYRQFATISIFVFSLYLLLRKTNAVVPIILNFLAIFIHKLAVLQLFVILIIIFYKSFKPRSKFDISPLKLNLHFLIISGCLVVRLGLYFLLNVGSVQAFLSSFDYTSNVTMINNGLLSRLTMLVLILIVADYKQIDENTSLLLFIYYFAILLYCAVPFELIMGRLVNNFRILEIIIIPNLMFSKNKKPFKLKRERYFSEACKLMMICVACTVFIVQLVTQIGYVPFVNYFVGGI